MINLVILYNIFFSVKINLYLKINKNYIYDILMIKKILLVVLINLINWVWWVCYLFIFFFIFVLCGYLWWCY